MPYYVVTEQTNEEGKPGKESLVKAKNRAQALSAVVEPRFLVRTAENGDLIALAFKGIVPIEAK